MRLLLAFDQSVQLSADKKKLKDESWYGTLSFLSSPATPLRLLRKLPGAIANNEIHVVYFS